MSISLGKVVVVSIFKRLWRGLRKRRVKVGVALTAKLEAAMVREMEQRSGELVKRLERSMTAMAIENEIPPAAVSKITSKLSFEMGVAIPIWADAAVDFLRDKLRLPDDD